MAWSLAAVLGNCMHGKKDLYTSTRAVSLAQGLVLLSIPIFIVWKMHSVQRSKSQLTLILSLGGIVCAFSLLRIVEFLHSRNTHLTSTGSLETIWTILELNLTIACACMAFMRPLLHAWKSPFRHMRKRSSQHDHSVDFTQFLSQWPYKTGSSMFSRDVCSLVCASAYPTPATEASQDRNELDLRGIMVQTSIDRDVQDRGVVLASILGGTRSMIESIGLSSRRESAGY